MLVMLCFETFVACHGIITYIVNIALALAAHAELIPAHVRARPPELLVFLDIATLSVVVEHHVAIGLGAPRRSGRVTLAMEAVKIEVRRGKGDEYDQSGQKARHC